jgi:hypothetical protein
MADLAAIFQPSILYHSERNWWDGEQKRCHKVLAFMIERWKDVLEDHMARLIAELPSH